MKRDLQPGARGLAASYREIYCEMHTMAAAITGNERAAGETLLNVIIKTGKNPGRARALEKTKLAALEYVRNEPGGLFECFEEDTYLSEEEGENGL